MTAGDTCTGHVQVLGCLATAQQRGCLLCACHVWKPQEHKAALEAEAALCEKKLERATKLIGGLGVRPACLSKLMAGC